MKEFLSEKQGPETKKTGFDSQFDETRELNVCNEPVKFVDLSPEKQKFETPLFVSPGWAETPTTLKNALRVFFDAGRRVMSVEHGRLVPKTSDENTKIFFSPLTPEEKEKMKEYGLSGEVNDQDGIPMPELLKARAILAVLSEAGIKKVDVVAHSEGAINTLIAAALSPEKFRNIILVGPAGLTEKGEDNALKRAVGFIRTEIQDVGKLVNNPASREILKRAKKEVVKYIAKSPIAALEEVGAIASSNIKNILIGLHQKGIKISIVHGGEEKMFPVEEMRKMTEDDAVYEFYETKGNDHHSIYMDEEAVFIENILASMENRE